MAKTPIHLIWNNHAGSAEAHQDVLEMFRHRDDVTVHQPGSEDETRSLTSELSEGGARIVIAAGGDGTVNSVVQGLVQAGGAAALAILPLGTGNDLCRSLSIPIDARQAAGLVDQGEPRRIDIIRTTSAGQIAHYANMATGGNTGQFMDRLTDDMKRFWGPLVYLRGVVDVLADLVTFHLTLKFDNEPPQQVDALNVFVANGRTSGTGLQVAPDANIEDGLVDVIVVQDCEPIQIAGLAADFALGDYRQNENILYRRVAKVSIQSTPPMTFTADGNLLTDKPVEFEVLPATLPVLVGPNYVAAPATDSHS